ncbi:9700_t:CDS:1 [Paraglomus occultum]|uniref:9700_t:CDS:1 n=1 Tax=Paraglomus occultum TaxID=144539 RepID=A0A9N8W2K4_9GLOM|nr:9700_t:CDS:1 [Paraglomus occultum]
MDLSWCPVCDRQVFAMDSLYCSEKCQRQDAISLPNPSSLSNYTFSRRQSPKSSPYASPIGSPLSSPMLYFTRRFDYFDTSDDLSASPEDLLLSNQYDRGTHDTLRARGLDEGINDDGMCLTVVHMSTVVTAATTTVTTITVETREVQPAPVLKKKRSLIESAWRMLFN